MVIMEEAMVVTEEMEVVEATVEKHVVVVVTARAMIIGATTVTGSAMVVIK